DGAVRRLAQVRVELFVSSKVTPQDIFGVTHPEPGHHRKSLRANAVDDAKIQTLGKVALFFRHLLRRDAEHLRRRHLVQISARSECVNESFVAGKLSEDPQLDLRIISNYQAARCRMAHEATSILDRVRHLLNVWIRAGESSRRRADLPKVRMQPARLWIDELDHVLTIAGQGLLHRAV